MALTCKAPVHIVSRATNEIIDFDRPAIERYEQLKKMTSTREPRCQLQEDFYFDSIPVMGVTHLEKSSAAHYRWQYGKLIPYAVIRHLARQIVKHFHPEKIILFGSYAYGKPHKDSDVDILVVMPAYDESTQAVRIKEKTDPCFPVDLVVRTPENLRWRLEEGDWFLHEIVGQGNILYEKTDGRLDAKGRKRSRRRK